MKIVSDHGFPKGDGSHPDDDAFDRFKNEREYIAQSGRMKTTVAAMDWAATEIERLTMELEDAHDRLKAWDAQLFASGLEAGHRDMWTKIERERCASIALAIDSGRGNEKEIAKAIRAPLPNGKQP